MKINNRIYDDLAQGWWDEDGDGSLVSLRFLSNPVRFQYINTIITDHRKAHPQHKSVLDVGCGGGYLTEELARAGLDVTGIDPSLKSIAAAREHARLESLTIPFASGYGENLPFESNAFDFVCCCDVLEHVEAFDVLVKEISRVLKQGGIFFYDTINRTIMSKLIMIKVLQEWKGTSILEPDIHMWKMFIKPKELLDVLYNNHMVNWEIKGMSTSLNFVSHFFSLRARRSGRISWRELGRRLNLKISNNRSCNYIGYAVKAHA